MTPRPDMMVRRHDGLISEIVLEDVVVLDPETSRYVRLNSSAAVLWQLLESGPTTVSNLARVLRERLGAPEQDALEDAAAFVTAMAERELIELVPA
ncbi:MAG: PqqD family protein [Thermoleophilia bacterium]|nr:PqqD family protein [Thermoleophilia bacterium]